MKLRFFLRFKSSQYILYVEELYFKLNSSLYTFIKIITICNFGLLLLIAQIFRTKTDSLYTTHRFSIKISLNLFLEVVLGSTNNVTIHKIIAIYYIRITYMSDCILLIR